MPGLFGIITARPSTTLAGDLECMAQALRHESSYVSGSAVDPEQQWAVGWTCLPGSFTDCLPVWNASQNLALFFHGENFLAPSVLADLRQRRALPGPADARSLMQIYEEQGEDFLPSLNGFFHGVLVDLKRRRFVLFNDRYGMQRLYVHERDGVFLFASEAKALLRLNPRLRDLVPEHYGEFLAMQCVLENRTIFPEVSLLPGASRWVFEGGVCTRKAQYFQPVEWESQPPVSAEHFYQQLKETITSVLPEYLRAARRVGLSLTGGLDSRLILAAYRTAPGTIPCYTFGSRYNDSVDLKVARQVAAVCGQSHSTIRIDAAFLRAFAGLTRQAVYISDGYLDAASGAVELHANRLAREIAPVRITGNYGSEILRTVRAFRHRTPDPALFAPELYQHAERSVAKFNRSLAGHPLTFAAFRQAPWFNYNRSSLEQSQLTVRSPYLDNRLVACAYRAPLPAISDDTVFLRLLDELHPGLGGIVTNRGAGGAESQWKFRLMRSYYEGWHKVEYGYDYNLPQFAARIDYFLRPLHLERLLLGRQKFYFFRIWYRDELAPFIREVLLDPQSLDAPFLNRKHVESLVMAHTRGYANHTKSITTLLTYVLTRHSLLQAR